MNESSYWTLLERSWEPNDDSDPYHRLKEDLEKLSIDELFSFMVLFDTYRERLLTPAHLSAAYLLNEGIFGEEEFSLYSEAVVAVPQRIYVDVEQNPDHILDHKIYEDSVLNNDGYPFASLPNIVGKDKYDREWRVKVRGGPFKPIDLDCFRANGYFRQEIISPAACEKRVPRLYSIYGAKCTWD